MNDGYYIINACDAVKRSRQKKNHHSLLACGALCIMGLVFSIYLEVIVIPKTQCNPAIPLTFKDCSDNHAKDGCFST